ncbi:amino acid ABC transporter permease [Microvirga sp. VF16]|uniref:amino acid ABC transporter permease n=1 Tax=Microvirga sp. VF16 TaxID=2807101 RepID=UPI00193E9D0C|nr:ABC transporter permease subunit [Microvirga sp. VF16]QRM35285.1 ABC transporter permease subunit [Microvirga sp. VF16]
MSRLWFDARFRSYLWQSLILLAFLATVAWLTANTLDNLVRRGIQTGFGFLSRPARFPIAEGFLAYDPTNPYLKAFAVGLLNTLYISMIVIVVATAFGFCIGLGRRSLNPLVRGLASCFVETMRNTPLVVQLLFWYALLTIGLPAPRAALEPMPGLFLSLRGLFFPWPIVEGGNGLFGSVLLLGSAMALGALAWQSRLGRPTRRIPALCAGLLGLVVLLFGLTVWASDIRLSLDRPVLRGFNFTGGATLTPEFMALVVGLVLYTAAFVAEIVRGGIDAVPKGQWESGRALGLREARILWLVVVPQALRIIVPPMTSQFLNVVKNTTLALAVGYPDFASVMATTINQTGQAIEGVLILMSVYLAISLSVSAFMNWYNRRMMLVTR